MISQLAYSDMCLLKLICENFALKTGHLLLVKFRLFATLLNKVTLQYIIDGTARMDVYIDY